MSFLLSAVSYNRPKFSHNALWNSDAITVINFTALSRKPTRIFINNENRWYTVDDGNGQVLSWSEGGINLTTAAQGAYGIFVSPDKSVYTYDDYKKQIGIWPANGTSSYPIMFISQPCRGLFVDTNNSLYCSVTEMNQVVTKSLYDATNTITTVAGTGCGGSASDMLNSPNGIFVDLNFSLFVADTGNDRVQRFTPGQMNASTVAGSVASGTITLHAPTDVISGW